MKNQGVWVTRIVMFAIFIFVVAYMGYHVVSALSAPLRTTTAILYKTEETAAFSGLIIRDEAAIGLPSGFLEFRAAEGERVAKDQILAVTYSDPSAMRVNEDLRILEARLEQFEYIQSHTEFVASVSELDGSIQEGLAEIMSRASSGTLEGLGDDIFQLKANLLRREYTYGNISGLSETISELNGQADVLRQQVSGAESQMRSPEAGTFSSRSDGLEDRLSPKSMENLTSEELEELLNTPVSGYAEGKGKLVYGINWYLAVEFPEDSAPAEGKLVEMRLNDGQELFMRAQSSVLQPDGTRVVIFSSAEGLSRMISERRLSGEIILSKSEGIRVPKEAVRYDDEGVFVYCAVISQIQRKPVTIIHEVDRENYFLVEYTPGSPESLYPGDELIVAGKDLHDGKVLE